MTATVPRSIWRRAVSHALVFLTAWLSLAPALHGAGHDQDCDPAILIHDASQHALTAGTSDLEVHPGDHCIACHLFRSSRHAAAWKFIPQALNEGDVALQIDARAISSRASVPLPARAPPALA